MLIMMPYRMPLFSASTQYQVSLVEFLSPVIIGGIISAGYSLKRTNDSLCAFNNINKEMKENAIPEIKNWNDCKVFEREKRMAINDTCVTRMQLENEMQKLKCLKASTPEEDKTPKLSQESIEVVKKYDLDQEFEQKLDEGLEGELSQEEKGRALKKTLFNKNSK